MRINSIVTELDKSLANSHTNFGIGLLTHYAYIPPGELSSHGSKPNTLNSYLHVINSNLTISINIHEYEEVELLLSPLILSKMAFPLQLLDLLL
jgi:hypothetical protein